MQHLISLGLCTIISLSLSSQTPVSAKGDGLPRVSTIDNAIGGAGCTLWLSNSKSKKTIFFDDAVESNTRMNFDGRDTKLKMVSQRSKGKNTTTIYTANHLRVEVEIRAIAKAKYNESPNNTATIVITNNGRSKIVKAIGYCGC